MPRLFLLEGPSRGAVYPMGDRSLTIGRDSACELPLADDRVSRAHARVRWEQGSWVIEDLASRNGTFVNAVPCETRELSPGDEIRIGDSLLLFLEEEHDAGPTPCGSTMGARVPPGAGGFAAASVLARRLEIVAESAEMKQVLRFVAKVAPRDSTVLITGDSGAGKEVVAQAIHQNSARRDGPLVALNCAAVAAPLFESELFGHEKGAFTDASARKAGRLEMAAAGTLFLDEIGELPLDVQAKLLRVLSGGDYQRVGGTESLRCSARLVAATNRDLKAMVKAGTFREDLFYRINVLQVEIPPLRLRRKDIRPLVEFFLKKFRDQTATALKVIAPEAMACLEAWDWPGNVRELRNVIERVVMLAEEETLRPEHLPLEVQGRVAVDSGEEPTSLRELEKRHIRRVLDASGWNKSRAAVLLGIDRKTLYAKIEEYGLVAPGRA